MRKLLLPLAILTFCVAINGQRPAPAPTSPKAVVQKYLTMAGNGLLLTAKGWREASNLFVQPSPFPTNDAILVVSDRGALDESWVRGDHAEETASGYDALGRIDPSFRFAPAPKSAFYETEIAYHLVLIRESGDSDHQSDKTKSRSGWLIENPPGPRWTTASGAIRYLRSERMKVAKPSIMKYIDQTISELRRSE